MRTQLSKIVLAAAFGLALALTFSCGDHSLDDWLNDSSSSHAMPNSGTSSSGTRPSSSSSSNVIVYGRPITDARDGQTYETVVIGTQTWMAKNLNYEAEGAKCYFEGTRLVSADSIARNCEIYGRLYSWETAMSACPAGWHLPYYAEWKQLLDYVGTDYRKLTTANSDNGAIYTGTDDYGFSGLPGGKYSDRNFNDIYYYGFWWSATEFTSSAAQNISNFIGIVGSYNKSSLLSVRCVQGPPGCTSADNTDTHYCLNESGTMKEYGSMTDKAGKTYKTVVIGEQTWMAENINYVDDEVEKYSKCYDNKPENCDKYGRLYDWLAAMEVCPSGWHLPSDAEWATMKEALKGNSSAYGLVARGRGYGVDSYGFSALLGGYGCGSSCFSGAGSTERWWTITAADASKATYWVIDGTVIVGNNIAKTNFSSVRCVKN